MEKFYNEELLEIPNQDFSSPEDVDMAFQEYYDRIKLIEECTIDGDFRSKVMKDAWKLFKSNEYTKFKDALKEAWANAKYVRYLKIIQIKKMEDEILRERARDNLKEISSPKGGLQLYGGTEIYERYDYDDLPF